MVVGGGLLVLGRLPLRLPSSSKVAQLPALEHTRLSPTGACSSGPARGAACSTGQRGARTDTALPQADGKPLTDSP